MRANPEMKAFAETYEKITGIVLTVKDQASAKGAVEQLRPLIQQMQTQSQAINALSGPEINAAAKQAQSRLVTTAGKMAQHMASLPPDALETLDAALKKLPGLPAPV